MNRNIRNSAKALIIKEQKLLVIKINDGDSEWYILPGGGQESEELLTTTVCREVLEEVGVEVEVKELAFVIEGAYGETFHRVDVVFLCRYIGERTDVNFKNDWNQVGYEWIDIHTLNTAPLYPSKLRRQIMNLHEGKPYKVYLGNENIGDPEITD